MGILKGFDDAFEDGRFTEQDYDFPKKYDVAAMIKKAEELKRPLTDEEMEEFRRNGQ